jgi:DNA-3-methyladenine glycosylase
VRRAGDRKRGADQSPAADQRARGNATAARVGDDRLLCSGPGRLCQALGLTRAHDGLPLDAAPFRLEPSVAGLDITAGPRIGITRAAETPWRFGIRRCPYISRRFP